MLPLVVQLDCFFPRRRLVGCCCSRKKKTTPKRGRPLRNESTRANRGCSLSLFGSFHGLLNAQSVLCTRDTRRIVHCRHFMYGQKSFGKKKPMKQIVLYVVGINFAREPVPNNESCYPNETHGNYPNFYFGLKRKPVSYSLFAKNELRRYQF